MDTEDRMSKLMWQPTNLWKEKIFAWNILKDVFVVQQLQMAAAFRELHG